MIRHLLSLSLATLALSACQSSTSYTKQTYDFSAIQRDFEDQILNGILEEGPFSLNYSIRTVFLSDRVVSLFAELTVEDRLPRGWKLYEGRTLHKQSGKWQKVSLADIFPEVDHREIIRIHCESSLKRNHLSYFSTENPLRTALQPTEIHTFVVDDKNLIIIFQPYSVAGGVDGPVAVKIPLSKLQEQRALHHPIFASIEQANRSGNYVSSWNLEEFYERITDQ